MSPSKSGWERIILHGDMDAFFAAVEQRDRPELHGKPVVVGGIGARAVVSTASYEARRFGIHSAMPMARALALCPSAVVLPPDFARYQETSLRINEVFNRYSPLVEPLSLDEAFLDMTGAERLFGTPEEMAARLKRDVREATDGLTISVGVSTTKYVAKVASDHQKPDGLTVVREDVVLSFLHPLKVARLWGVGNKSQRILTEAGLRTIGDVAAAGRPKLTSLLGASLGGHVFDLAQGIDPREVVPDRDPKSIGKEFTLETDIRGKDAIMPVLRAAADKVARALRREGLTAAGVRIKLKTADFRLLTRQENLVVPTDSASFLLEPAVKLLMRMPLDLDFRLVGLAAFQLASKDRNAQVSLFPDPARDKQRRLDRALDAVREKFGDPALSRGDEASRFNRTEIRKKTETDDP